MALHVISPYIPTEIYQHVVADANNSSTTNLAAGNSYTFTGTKTSSLGVAGIQVSLFANKDCLIYVEQSPEGTNWDLSDRFIYQASTNFGTTVQAVSSYLRVRVTTRSETTTIFRLQTALCPIVEAVPRTLDENGNFKVAAPVDSNNFQSENTPMGELRVAEKVRLAGAQFDGAAVDTNYWTTSVSTGTVAQAGTEVTITSGTAAGHYARLYSVRRARYVAGVANKLRVHVRLADTGTANVKRRWGIAWGATMPTITDGAYFELDGTTFSVVTLKGTTETRVSSGAFNGHGGYTYTLDTNYHVYEILYTNANVLFSIDKQLVHKASASAATWTNTMNHHIWLDVVNADASAAVAMYCRVASISRLGKLETQPKYYNLTGNAATHTLKIGAGSLHKIIFNNTSGTSFIIYDQTTAAVPTIGTVVTAAAALGSWDYHCPFYNGLVIVTTGNGLDLTVVYE